MKVNPVERRQCPNARSADHACQPVACQRCANLQAGCGDGVPGLHALHDFQRLQGRRRSDALGPEGAADEGGLRRLHDFAPADGGGNGIAVAQRLAEHGHVGLDAVHLVQAAEGLAEAGGAFVEDQHDAAIGRQLAHLLQEVVFRALCCARLPS